MFEIINNTNNEIENKSIIEDYLRFLVKEEKLSKALFNIIFISREEIKQINNDYRNKDMETDVISFALEDTKDIIYQDFRLLGDIYICLDIAYKQAELYNHSHLREICFLITHGLLHLLGYDHLTESEEEIMFTKQKELLDIYEIKR